MRNERDEPSLKKRPTSYIKNKTSFLKRWDIKTILDKDRALCVHVVKYLFIFIYDTFSYA